MGVCTGMGFWKTVNFYKKFRTNAEKSVIESEEQNQSFSMFFNKHRNQVVISGNWNAFPDGPPDQQKAVRRMCQEKFRLSLFRFPKENTQ